MLADVVGLVLFDIDPVGEAKFTTDAGSIPEVVAVPLIALDDVVELEASEPSSTTAARGVP